MAKTTQYSVNLGSPVAVYVQIENQVQFDIAAGKLKPGDALPAVREMAEMLGVNPNTITKSYRDLEVMGIVTTRRGVGVTIADHAPAVCRQSIREMAHQHLQDAVSECVASGFSRAEVQKVVSQTIQSGRRPYTG